MIPCPICGKDICRGEFVVRVYEVGGATMQNGHPQLLLSNTTSDKMLMAHQTCPRQEDVTHGPDCNQDARPGN